MVKKKNTQNRWTKEELELLMSLRDRDLTYQDVANTIKSKNATEVKNKCEYMRITRSFRDMNGWSKEDIELLRRLYPATPNEELPKFFNGKTEGSIYSKANRIGLKKMYNHRLLLEQNKSKWNNEKNDILISIFNEKGENECYKYFKEKYGHKKHYIREKLIDNELLDIYKIKNKNNITLSDVFNIYKLILNGRMNGFNEIICRPSREQLALLFKYYVMIKNINISRDYLLNVTYGQLLEECKLKSLIKDRFDGYYDFICFCYPKYSLKPWEFKKLDVPNGFWNDKFNRFWCIREGLNKLLRDKTISFIEEAIELDRDVLGEYMSTSLLYYHTKDCIIEYFDYIHNSNYDNVKKYNNIRFDSYQEKQVYKFIFEQMTKDILKCSKKDGFYYSNDEYHENYIPDFYIKIDDKTLIIEYFGMYRTDHPNAIFKEYCNKTKRKIKYYNSLENIYFIDLYPNDLLSGFKGVSEKLMPFLSSNYYVEGR